MHELLATAFARGVVPTIPSIVIAEVWRGDAKDALLARLLKTCVVEPLDERRARTAGALRRAVDGAAAIDACVAAGVRERGDAHATSDPQDMRHLLGPRAVILTV